MSLSIQVEDFTDTEMCLKDPIVTYGAKHGTLWRMYSNNKPEETYFISTGINNNPVMVWWNDECGQFSLSSQNVKDLEAYNPWIKVRKCGPLSIVKLTIDIEDYDDLHGKIWSKERLADLVAFYNQTD